MTPTARNLTGVWIGHYSQNNRPSPITAEFSHEGDRLTGSMSDGVTDRTSSVFEVASEAGLAPGADERIVASLRELLPDEPLAPISYVSHLPPGSLLAGSVEGPRVGFVKTYQGTAFGGYKVGDRFVVQEDDAHRVNYRGTVAADGQEIEGRWWIDPDPETGSARVEGSFTLRREPEGGGPS